MSEQKIIVGDCAASMRAMPANSVDAVVCDPPYGLGTEPDMAVVMGHWMAGDDYQHRGGGFMGKSWDSFVPGPAVWREALRVLKPGGHLIAFFGTRTYDLGVLAIRLAGFHIRDQLAWMFGSGFPKSMNVAKAIDGGGGRPEDIRRTEMGEAYEPLGTERTAVDHTPVSENAKAWEGWGTALKPAYEPIVLARKPLESTVARNVLKHGTGALNIDGSRTPMNEEDREKFARGSEAWARRDERAGTGEKQADIYGVYGAQDPTTAHENGRWPSNVLLDEGAAGALDEQTGVSQSRVGAPRAGAAGSGWGMTATGAEYDDAGGASRFFYVAKASSAERNAGLASFEKRDVNEKVPGGSRGEASSPRDGAGRLAARANHHPTVKPVSLMRWLIGLVTPPGGLVLDPFMGSGTTGCAAALDDVEFVGCELDPEYAKVAEARIAWWKQQPADVPIDRLLGGDREREKVAAVGQTGLF